jgi:glycosyltransferase involved in cell wall biosynthesis
MPKVSVIVPSYNHARYLSKRLESIFNQTYQDFEVILLDDCSTDNSSELLTKYSTNPKVSHFIVNRKNSGSTFRQWEKGIALAKGEYIWIAESDDFNELTFLENSMDILKIDNSIAFSYCRTKKINEEDKIIGNEVWGEEINPQIWEENRVFSGLEFLRDYLKYRNIIPNTSAVVFRKNHFDPWIVTKLKYCGDWLLWGIMCKNSKVGFLSKHLNFFRHHVETTRVFKSKRHQRDHARECQFVKISIQRILLKNNSQKIIGNDFSRDNKVWKIKIWIFYKFYFLREHFSIKFQLLKSIIKSIPIVFFFYKQAHSAYSFVKNYFSKNRLKQAS